MTAHIYLQLALLSSIGVRHLEATEMRRFISSSGLSLIPRAMRSRRALHDMKHLDRSRFNSRK